MLYRRHQHDGGPPASLSDSRFFAFGRASDGRYPFSANDLPDRVGLIGSGEIGGKARGLIFAMQHMNQGPPLTAHQHLLRFPDSTIVATGVFDDFMEENALARVVTAGCQGEISLQEVNEQIVAATFPPVWEERLVPLLEWERRPIVVRSSSLMEDDPNHSFAGIYLSDFLANRGPLETRLRQLTEAIKRVYASCFAPNARAYRKRHTLDWRKEKMAVLIQNMIGSQYSHGLFYPLVGGVAFSRNFYPWTPRLKPEDGVVRLVVGTGTRAVGREFARVFSPGLPGLRPEGSDTESFVRYSQETVDVLDLAAGRLTQTRLNKLGNPLLTKICSIVGSDGTLREPLSTAAMLATEDRFVASFSRLIEGSSLMPFTPLIRDLLSSLADLLELPVDIEFAVDFSGPEASREESPLFYLLQVRPLGTREEHHRIQPPEIPADTLVLETRRVLGNGMLEGIRHLILVEPSSYRWEQAYEIARTIGRINDQLLENNESYILMGPGRWASSNPQLGVPVQYGEISGASVLVEMSTAFFSPELSYGTHFYAEMVGSGVLYLPLHEGEGDELNRPLLDRHQIAYRDDFITHYIISNGLNVYVDGETRRGIIALRTSTMG